MGIPLNNVFEFHEEGANILFPHFPTTVKHFICKGGRFFVSRQRFIYFIMSEKSSDLDLDEVGVESSSSSSQSITPTSRSGRGRGSRGRVKKSQTSVTRRGVRGRGRRVSKTLPISVSKDILTLTQQKKDRLKERVCKLPRQELEDLMVKIIEHQPGLVMNVMEKTSASGGYHPEPSTNSPDWCSCLNCREMPTEQERICCTFTPDSCISKLPDMEVLVLDESVLALARLLYRDVLILPDDDDLNKGYRHTAYKQFVLWQHGKLGAGVRCVIPSCCVWKIRDKFPDAFGQYKGFLPSRIGI